MLVGHLPHLKKLASYLIAGDETIRVILFRNGAVNCLERRGDGQPVSGAEEVDRWSVRWIMTPELIPG